MLLITGCEATETGSSGDRLQVVATTGIVGDLVQNIGGSEVEVVALMGPGVDPHLYRASEGDVRRLAAADLIMYNGLHLEAAMADVLEQMQGRKRTVAVGDAIAPERLLSPSEFAGAYDPHIWFDVSLWMQGAERVRDALIEADPAHTAEYRANTEAYLAELEELDAYVQAQAERVPPETRVLITAHDAFNYFGRAYDFEVRGLQGINTASEAGIGDVRALADFIARQRIPAIFIESSIPPRTVEAVQAAARARGYDVEIGGELFSDALGNPGTPAGTYVGTVRHNIDTIVGALLGDESSEPS